MSLRLAPYPAYKDSGVPWLGTIPEHWTTTRFKSVVRNVVEQTLTRETGDAYIALEHVESWTGRIIAKEVEFSGAVKRFKTDDVLFGKLRPYLAKVTRPKNSGVCVGEFLVLRTTAADARPDFIEQALRSAPFIQLVNSATFGAKMPRAEWSVIGDIQVPQPEPAEQEAIVRFLDHTDRRINRLIRAKRRLIDLLNEQKQAIIHRAVTRGLDPNVRLKPSGIDWLGDVPEGWEVRKLGHVARVFNGTTPSRMQPRYWDQGNAAWLASGKVNDYVVRTPTDLISEDAVRECSLSLVPKGALILGMVGQGKTRGMSARLAIDAYINQNLAAIIPRSGIDGQFLHFLLIAAYGSIREAGRGGNQEALNCEIVRSLRFPLPSPIEQVAIGRAVGESTAELDRAVDHARREIDLLREYRTRLIADVVTGKLDVRGVELPPLDGDGALDEIDAPDDDAEELLEGGEDGDGAA